MIDFDIDKICRVCLQSNIELSLLFDEKNAVDGLCLSDMITACTIYTVQRHDEFPHLICDDCIKSVQNAYRFKKQFETSHRKLITFFDSVNKVLVDTKPGIYNDKSIQTEETTLYPCEKCDEKFLNYENLRYHRLVSHKGTANVCRICLKTFNRIGDLKNHIAICHPEIGHKVPHECNICKRRFTRKDHVIRHMRNVHKLTAGQESTSKIETRSIGNDILLETEIEFGSFTVQEVTAEFEDNMSSDIDFADTNPFSSDDDEIPLSALQNAIITESKNLRNIKVEIKPDDNSYVDLDITQNTEEPKPNSAINNEAVNSCQKLQNRKYKCMECDKLFTRSSHVKRHLLSHRQEKPFACKVCDKRFGRSDHFKTHIAKHDANRPFPCDSCSQSYTRSDLLKRHKEHKHMGTIPEKTEVCEICKKSFSTKNYLQKHMRLHTDKIWKCKFCAIEFDSKESLKIHAKSHNKEKPFLCSECGFCFVRRDYLLIHMRRHNGEKPYKCKYCGKGFPRATDLNVHEKYHTGEKTHLCTVCGKGFQRAYNLIVHMRVHTGERPYQCPSCPKNFAQCNDLKAHVRRHTGERYKCEICGTGFIQGYHLTQHKLTVHGIEVEQRIGRLTKVFRNDSEKVASEVVLNEPIEQIKLEQP